MFFDTSLLFSDFSSPVQLQGKARLTWKYFLILCPVCPF